MNAIFKKLNYKEALGNIVVFNAPESFGKELREMKATTTVLASPPATGELSFVLSFVTKQKEVDTLTEKIVPRLSADGVFWFAYPKGTSKRYKCEFNRDSGWALLGKNNFEPVRMVAIDEDWSALRFRRVDQIKTMTRSRTISDAGKQKTSQVTGNKTRSKGTSNTKNK